MCPTHRQTDTQTTLCATSVATSVHCVQAIWPKMYQTGGEVVHYRSKTVQLWDSASLTDRPGGLSFSPIIYLAFHDPGFATVVGRYPVEVVVLRTVIRCSLVPTDSWRYINIYGFFVNAVQSRTGTSAYSCCFDLFVYALYLLLLFCLICLYNPNWLNGTTTILYIIHGMPNTAKYDRGVRYKGASPKGRGQGCVEYYPN